MIKRSKKSAEQNMKRRLGTRRQLKPDQLQERGEGSGGGEGHVTDTQSSLTKGQG